MYFIDLTARTTQWKYPADKLPQKPQNTPPPSSPLPHSSPLAGTSNAAAAVATGQTDASSPASATGNSSKAGTSDVSGDVTGFDDLMTTGVSVFDDDVIMGEENSAYEYLCIECKKNEMDSVFVPCAHMCMCMDCAKKAVFCPLCSGAVNGLNRFYK